MGLMPEFSTDFGYNVAIEIPFSAELSIKKIVLYSQGLI